MKVSLVNTLPVNEKQTYLLYLITLLENTLKDMGYYSIVEEADVVIAIRSFPVGFVAKSGVKYVWLQIENKDYCPDRIQKLYEIGPKNLSAVWGWCIEDETEIYTPLGYHPSVDFTLNAGNPNYVNDVGIIGTLTEKRNKLYKSAGINVVKIQGFELGQKFVGCYNTKINVDSRSFDMNNYFTAWERLSFLISNKCFVLSECAYFPSSLLTQFERDSVVDFKQKVEFCLCNDSYRNCNVEEIYNWYKRDMLMVDILEDRLKRLK